MGPYSLIPHAPQTLLIAQTAATGGSGGILFTLGQIARATVILQSDGTTSGGTIAIEEAYYDPKGPVYAGTWSLIQTVNASSFTGTAQLVIHITGSVWALRTRIATDITGGGTVSSWAYGN